MRTSARILSVAVMTVPLVMRILILVSSLGESRGRDNRFAQYFETFVCFLFCQ